jgi:DNA (cytosine-5)-methyltransferase 1
MLGEEIILASCYRVLDLFAGIGGLSYGFELVKSQDGRPAFELVCAVEKDPYACETLRVNLKRRGRNPDVVLEADLTDPETHREIIKRCQGHVDIIIGGPPCQSFSSIGARSAAWPVRQKWLEDDRDRLYLEYVKLVKELKPAFLVFENVQGILTKKDSAGNRYIDLVVRAIKDCGYTTSFSDHSADYIELNAADYGVPQIRERVFIIANRLGINNPCPKKTHSPDGKGLLPYVTLYDAIGDLPPVQAHITSVGLPPEKKQEIANLNKHRYRGEDDMPYHWERFYTHRTRLGPQGQQFLDFIKPTRIDARLTGHVARGQQQSDIELFERMPPGCTSKDIFYGSDPYLKELRVLIKYDMKSFRDKYKKHSWDKPCTTVFAHLQKDGNRFIHPDSNQARTFTVREVARIQSFPDDFVFTAPGNIRYKYIGNAVPPLLAKAIGQAIFEVLESLKGKGMGQVCLGAR